MLEGIANPLPFIHFQFFSYIQRSSQTVIALIFNEGLLWSQSMCRLYKGEGAALQLQFKARNGRFTIQITGFLVPVSQVQSSYQTPIYDLNDILGLLLHLQSSKS